MSARAVIVVGLKVAALTFILAASFILAAGLSGMSGPAGRPAPPAPAAGGAVLLDLLLFSLLVAVVFTAIMLRSRWHGWKLVGAVFLAYYGLSTVVTQIESAAFLPRHLPPGMIARICLMGAITAALFAPLAVLVLGKMRRTSTPRERGVSAAMPPAEWGWKLAAIAGAYLALYLTFGYFVAWRNPAVRAYYGGTDPGSFLAQLGRIWKATPWLYALQVFRALLWAMFALPVIRMLEGRRGETALAVALLFAVWSAMLLLPSPFMPDAVRRTHLVETAPSNFLFGVLVGWLLSRRDSSPRAPARAAAGSEARLPAEDAAE